jgi:hypothetical protein
MNILSLMFLFLLIFPESAKGPLSDAASVLNYARSIDVGLLDSSLQSQRLDDWLRLGPAHIEKAQWEIRNCCNCDKTDGRICVYVGFNRGDGVNGEIMIHVGMRKSGIKQPPKIEYINIFRQVPKLSDIPGYILNNKNIIEYAKSIDVSVLDPDLHSQRLDDWLRLGPAHIADVEYHLSDCDLMSAPGNPLCIKFGFKQSGILLMGMIRIGSQNKISGKAKIEHLAVFDGTVLKPHNPGVGKLSELPAIMPTSNPKR